ncbi:MAG TPA: amino acid adenylation domain-containing protein, partial [Longimicrobiaceae bacterium]
QIFEHPTVAELARVAGRTGDLSVRAEQGVVTGEVPLTPVQHWFFGEEVPARHHWNQALLLDARAPLDPVLLERAWTALAGHHDALRMRFTHAADGWRQENAPDGEPVRVERIDLASVPAEEQPAEIDRAGARVQRSLDLAAGPLLRVALFERGTDRPQEMLVVIHHLVVDGVSWRVLLEDLETAYGQLSRGEAVALPAKTTSFRDWALRLAEHARSGGFDAELAYWEAGAGGSTPIPVDHPARTGANTVASARTVAVELTEEETAALLSEVPAAYHTQVNDALLAALAATLGEWTGGAARVELEGHGREEHLLPGTDLSRTVGWFTTLYPVVLEAGGSPGDTLKRVKERLRAAPERGIGYGGLRHLASGEARDRLAALPRPQVAFNYLGQLDRAASAETKTLFSLASGAVGDMTDPASTRPHLLTVNAGVEGGRLRVGWTYGEAVHRRGAVERLAERYVEALRELIAHCTSEEAGGWTPSDFPLAGLDQAALDALLGRGRDVEDVYPLTPMQEGMLFHALYSPEGGAYVEQFGFELEGTLDVEAFRRAWQGVAERHTVLRSGFAWEGVERPVQVVRRGGEVPLAVEDWRGVPAEEWEERLEAYLRADRAEGLALERGPLMRLALFRTEEERYRLVWTHHHLVLDGWSLPLVFREVVALYDAAVEGVEARLGEARPYRAYLAWLAGRDTAASEAYWRAELAGFEAATPLAADRRAEGAAGHPSYDTRSALLDEADTRRLQGLARRHGLTANTVVQGAWALLLSRYSGEEDVVFGGVVSGRPAGLEGVEEMVGLFINTLPVRVRVRPRTPVGTWLREIQEREAERREHEHTPLVQVQKWSGVPAGEALFESLLVFENYPLEDVLGQRERRLRVRTLGSREQTGYPLTLAVFPGERMVLHAQYDRARFDADSVERMLGHLATLLRGIAARPGSPLDELPLLDAAERERVVEEWNDTAAARPARPVHRLFAEQASRTPAAVAVKCGAERVTYAELDARAGRLARRLRALGAGPEARVGVALRRGVDSVATLLAVWKAGAVYVPLDPAYPAERLTYLLEDSGAALLVTDRESESRLPFTPARVVRVDEEGEAPGEEEAAGPGEEAGCGSLAYVIYTSGSTGRPKGVGVEHGSLANLLLSAREAMGEDAGEVPALAPLSFDISLFEVLFPLLAGGTARMVPAERVSDPDALAEEVAEAATVHAVPALMGPLVRALRGRGAPGPLRFLVGGDRIPSELVAEMREAFPAAQVHVMYGPTETTVLTSTLAVPAGEAVAGSTMGRPLGNVRTYVCDAWGEPAPVGVAGELYIGGVQVARGYPGRPELTAERFVPDPFGGGPGARLYRTGDRVRWRADGVLEFLGRTDSQVKVRGFRIEPGEVEAALERHPAVLAAAVVVREDGPGERRLVGYYTSAGEAPPAAELRAHLKAQLPEHMVPAALVALERLPLTAHGKLDRRALPAPEARVSDGEYERPRTEAEATLAGVWAEVLKRERVGVHDDFFELGGDSILSIQVVSRARRAGLHLTPRQLFENPSVAALAAVVGVTAGPAAEQGEVAGEVPLTPVQHGFFEQEVPERHHWNLPVLLTPREPLEPAALERALSRLAEHHDALRMRFREAEGEWRQENAPAGAPVPLDVFDLSALPEAERAAAIEREGARGQRSLDLADGPLFRAALFGLGAGGQRLLLVAHHLVMDGVSWRVLTEDLATA